MDLFVPNSSQIWCLLIKCSLFSRENFKPVEILFCPHYQKRALCYQKRALMQKSFTPFIPRRLRSMHRVSTNHSCWWCGKRGSKRTMYKLRDGPLNWWFCNDDHALEWLDYRHIPALNVMLRRLPRERDLCGKTIKEWVRDELSHV